MESTSMIHDENTSSIFRTSFNSEKIEFYYESFLNPRSKVDFKDEIVVKNIRLTKETSLPIAKVTQWLIL